LSLSFIFVSPPVPFAFGDCEFPFFPGTFSPRPIWRSHSWSPRFPLRVAAAVVSFPMNLSFSTHLAPRAFLLRIWRAFFCAPGFFLWSPLGLSVFPSPQHNLPSLSLWCRSRCRQDFLSLKLEVSPHYVVLAVFFFFHSRKLLHGISFNFRGWGVFRLPLFLVPRHPPPLFLVQRQFDRLSVAQFCPALIFGCFCF